MSQLSHESWLKKNQHYLMSAVAEVRAQLQEHYKKSSDVCTKDQPVSSSDNQQNTFQELSPSPALETLCASFGLSSFERAILLLCAGMELDAAFSDLISADSNRTAPVFNLAFSVFPDAHWSAIAPTSPLRRWRLIEVGSCNHLTNSPLQLDERILHYLTGISYLDSRLQGMIRPVQESPKLINSHRNLSEQMVKLWDKADRTSPSPIIQLTGEQQSSKQNIASSASLAMGLQLHVIDNRDIPVNSTEREALSRLWEREAVLSESALLVNCESVENQRAVNSFLENTHGILIVNTREPLPLCDRPSLSLEVPKFSTQEQLTLWHQALGSKAKKLNGLLENLAWQFQMDAQNVNAASAQMLNADPNIDSDELGAKLWDACRLQARQRLDELAQRIEPLAQWEDLVLPETQINTLREIAMHVRQRAKVYESWGFSAKGSRGLGISALFAGASGTGKTMAAEVLANELKLDLYHIDLSQIVNKYIGETEKNLRKVFDAAEQSGAILLFDEADALFGKRSDVKDSHDRYSNIECSYLLQRMEAYSGFSLLTTNMKQALDQAFLRRIRFVVQFPFPGAEQRAEIWQRIFPVKTPTENLDIKTLSRLDIAGGNIRNIAMNAAFLAAEADDSIKMPYVEHAARGEYMKLEKQMTGNEFAISRQRSVVSQKQKPNNKTLNTHGY